MNAVLPWSETRARLRADADRLRLLSAPALDGWSLYLCLPFLCVLLHRLAHHAHRNGWPRCGRVWWHLNTVRVDFAHAVAALGKEGMEVGQQEAAQDVDAAVLKLHQVHRLRPQQAVEAAQHLRLHAFDVDLEQINVVDAVLGSEVVAPHHTRRQRLRRQRMRVGRGGGKRRGLRIVVQGDGAGHASDGGG